MSPPLVRIRLGAAALAIAGVLFVLYPGTRPWQDESTVEGATAAMSSGWGGASHLFAIVAIVISWFGGGLTLPYYGAEDFGLSAIAAKAAAGQRLDLLDLVNAI